MDRPTAAQQSLVEDFAEALDDAFLNRAMKALVLLDRIARDINIKPAVEAELKRRKAENESQ